MFSSKTVTIHVLIRPRAGNFEYSPLELGVMMADIRVAAQAGAHGVVVGCLTSDGLIDMSAMRAVRHLTTQLGLMLTFHRAFDVCADHAAAWSQISLELRCDRLLTSGRQPSAVEGASYLASLQTRKQGGRLPLIVAAAGVSPAHAACLLTQGRVDGLHAGSALCRPVRRRMGGEGDKPRGVTMGTPREGEDSEWSWPCVEVSAVCELSNAVAVSYTHLTLPTIYSV
eukprot:TRINITY_DN23852_c0_g1_i1.p1 TRINITY_DN23852_c0_g1~~TRINITY_DN23852_c0_g1_i1.p1  ORF type:complete len:227 (+),score=38.60 TRINITY_DN23852_c0_g1_i1:283-963(+)